MFCMQCEQTISTPAVKGCVFAQGMCGKTAEVSDLQDILVRYLQGVSFGQNLAQITAITIMKSTAGVHRPSFQH